MSEETDDMLLDVPARPENVGLCRVAAAAFAGSLPFTLAEVEEIKVAVSEAVTNCVLHAYDAGRRGRVTVRAVRDGGRLEVEIRDTGRGIRDVAQARQPAFTTSDDPEHLGLGFTFMEQFMDEVDVESAPDAGTTVRLRKRPQG